MIARAALGIVAAMVLGACGDDSGGRPDPASRPRDEAITTITDGLWAATGIDVSQVTIGDYRYRFEPDTSGCADLPMDDRWLGVRMSSSPAGLGEQGTIEDSMSEYLESEGFTVEHLRRTNPAARARALNAVSDDMRVYAYLYEDGFTDVTVQAGPCAPTFGEFGDQFEPDT